MNSTTDYIINNIAAQSRARSAENRKVLVAMVKEKIGYNAPRSVSMRELKEILAQ